MDSLLRDEIAVFVLSDAAPGGSSSNDRGHLFERFAARLLEAYGYEKIELEDMNVTSEGIELDLVATHKLTNKRAVAECKAYTNSVAAKEMLAFVGKLTAERHDDPNTDGYFICLPKLTQSGAEKARSIEERDSSFHYLSAADVHKLLISASVLGADPPQVDQAVTSDRAVMITPHGVYSAVKRLDASARTPVEVMVWAEGGNVPEAALELVRNSDYAGGLACKSISESGDTVVIGRVDVPDDIVIEVRGGSSDFEYQFPAAPKYFVGRRQTLSEIAKRVDSGTRVLVVNAQSGWGKSSLALRLKRSVEAAGGVGLVLDSRTVSRPTYVASALRKAAEAASSAGILKLTSSASWASLTSAMRTLEESAWVSGSRRLLVVFDQFENIFRDEALTREFRDLAVLAADAKSSLVVGFAWKTDVVGWTEGYPYQLRDEIRQSAYVANLEPLGPNEIGTLLKRLEKELGSKLLPDLKVKLREYSQGLPWLMKKLASHVISESNRGIAQEDLAAEALNVQRLFENDLKELQPAEREALNWLAKFAPVLLSEALERFPAAVVQSLLDRRLMVQVGERLDTYWDIFRDFLTTGRVPIEDAYTLRLNPTSVGRLLQVLFDAGGSADVATLTLRLEWAENALFNVVREARVLGLVRSEARTISLLVADSDDTDPEDAVRSRVSAALKRHKVYSAFQELADRSDGAVTVQELAARLPALFPAIAAADATWTIYARVFAKWFEYAGLTSLQGAVMQAGEASENVLILDPSERSRGSNVFPQRAPGPALTFLEELAAEPTQRVPAAGVPATTVRDLIALGVVERDRSGYYHLVATELVQDGRYVPAQLLTLIRGIPGGAEAIDILLGDPKATDGCPPRCRAARCASHVVERWNQRTRRQALSSLGEPRRSVHWQGRATSATISVGSWGYGRD